MAKKPRKSGAKKRKEPTSSDAAPAGFSPEAQGFDYPAAVKKLQNVKSCVNETEIGKCVASINYKKKLPAIAAIMAFGCCICNTMLIAICGFVFCVVGPGLVGKDIDDFKEDYEATKEYIALTTGEIRELDWEWVKLKKNRDKLEGRSKKKVESKTLEKSIYKINEHVEVLYEGDYVEATITYVKPSDGTLSVRYKKDGDTESGIDPSRARKRPVDSDEEMEVVKKQDAAARAVLDDSCGLIQLWEIGGAKLGIKKRSGREAGANTKPKTIDAILGKLRDDVSGLQAVSGETALRAELSKTSLGAAADADADLEKLRETYVYGRVLELTHTIRLEKENFYKGGVFQEAEARAYVRSITDKTEKGKSRNDVLKAKLRKLGAYAGAADNYLATKLVKAYRDNSPEVVEAKEDPFHAPKLKAVMGSVRDALLKAKGHVIYVSKAWLVWLIATNRRPRTDLSFRNFKKEKGKGKRDDYFKNDGIYSGYKLKPEHQPIVDASEAYDEKKHILGEIMCGGAGSSGLMMVMFILFQKKYFVLMTRKQMVLVNPVTAGCLGYLASMVYSILSLKVGNAKLGGDLLAGGPRLSDVVKGNSDDPERLARRVVRTKWGPMKSVLDGFFASLLERLAATDGTLADAPADVAKAARAVDLDEYSAAQPEIGGSASWGFNRGAVEGFMLRLRGGTDDCCSPGPAPAPGPAPKKSKPGPRKRGLRAILGKRWSKAQVQDGWNAN